MAKSKLEYIWLDGNHPTQSLRGKTKVLADFNIRLLFSDVCKKRNDEGLEEYYSLGTTATTRYS